MTPSEYNHCVSKWADRLFRFACKSTGDREVAKDIVQQAFLTLWERREGVTADSGKAFLFTVAYRRGMDWHRNKRPEIEATLLEQRLHTRDKPPPDVKEILQRALNLLEEQARNLILLKDYEGYSYQEIAEITKLTPTQVKVYLHRARKILRNYLVSKEHLM